MTVLVALLFLAINLVLGVPLPFPQDDAVTTTPTSADFASLLPILQFFSTVVLADPTSDSSSVREPTQTSQFVPPPTSTTTSVSQTTSQQTTTSTTSTTTSLVQQQTQTSVQDVEAASEAENVQTGINHGAVTFGELTTPSEGGTFNKFVENDGNNSTTGEPATSTTTSVHPPPTGSQSKTTFAANTLTSHTFNTETTTARSTPSDAPVSRTGHHKHFSKSPSVPKASAASYNQPNASHRKPAAKRLFPSLFKDDEDFDRFDVPGLSTSNHGGGFSGQYPPPNVVPSSLSLLRPSGQSNGKNSKNVGQGGFNENESNVENGFSNGNEGNGGGSKNQEKQKNQSSKNSNEHEVRNKEASNGRNTSLNDNSVED